MTICLKNFHETEVRNAVKGNVEILGTDKSHFIRKALIWVVSELEKIEGDGVGTFLKEKFDILKKTELRECSKHLNDKQELLEFYRTHKKINLGIV